MMLITDKPMKGSGFIYIAVRLIRCSFTAM